jgi:hypothetical protein
MNRFLLALTCLPLALACSSNNCARDIQGTRSKDIPLATRQADCSKYMTATVYATPCVPILPITS